MAIQCDSPVKLIAYVCAWCAVRTIWIFQLKLTNQGQLAIPLYRSIFIHQSESWHMSAHIRGAWWMASLGKDKVTSTNNHACAQVIITLCLVTSKCLPHLDTNWWRLRLREWSLGPWSQFAVCSLLACLRLLITLLSWSHIGSEVTR